MSSSGTCRVARRDQRRQLAEDPERALLALEALDRVPLEDQLEAGGLCKRLPGVCADTAFRLLRLEKSETLPPILHFGKSLLQMK